MESQTYLHHPGNNEEGGARNKEEICISRESDEDLKTFKHALVPNVVPDPEPIPSSTATSRIPTLHLAMTKPGPAVTANTPAMTISASKQQALSQSSTTPAVDVLQLSSPPEPASGPSRSKSRSPNMSQNLKTQVGAHISSSPKNIHKTASTSDCPKMIHKTASASQISSFKSRTSLSHIPRATSSPKLKPSLFASLKVDKTEPNRRVNTPKGRMNESGNEDHKLDDVRKTEDDVGLQGTQVENGLKGSDLITVSTSGCKTEQPLNPSTPEDKSHTNVTTRQRQHDMERKTGERMEVQERRKEAEVKNTVMAEKTKTQRSQKLTDAEMTTNKTHDAALQTDFLPLYVDADVQVFVEVCNKSTGTSPVHIRPVVSPDLTLKSRFLGPRPYKSPNSQKSVQHVCQIEIELCSQSVSSAPCGAEQKNSKEMKGETEENITPQDIVWDEQGMTWEVYGASMDTESLGFAIQNHLQCKIREHERRIRTLRRSICLSEKSGTGKRNVLRSLFGGSKCCLKTQP